MTYKSSSTFYRLGYSVTWNVVNSPLHFNKSVRLNIVLNAFLKGMLKYFRIKLVKWIGNVEGNYFKLSLVTFDKAYPKYYKFRGKLKPMKFFSWNYLYFKKTSWLLGQLRDYYMKRHFKSRFKLGSGKYWHKFYTSIYFILNKNFKHTRKMFKNETINAEFLGSVRSEFSGILKLNNVLSFSVSKYSRLSQYQLMLKFYFKVCLYLNKWKIRHELNFQKNFFKLSFFVKSPVYLKLPDTVHLKAAEINFFYRLKQLKRKLSSKEIKIYFSVGDFLRWLVKKIWAGIKTVAKYIWYTTVVVVAVVGIVCAAGIDHTAINLIWEALDSGGVIEQMPNLEIPAVDIINEEEVIIKNEPWKLPKFRWLEYKRRGEAMAELMLRRDPFNIRNPVIPYKILKKYANERVNCFGETMWHED